ncbi:MAG: coproporphyrinogen dehydrogenase HemZ [Clostridia bacterium]|nr:coproporphyrinogen dehydrogenase HemZ [Clostridia bacterium]
MDIKVFGHEYFYDITSMSMLFFPGEKVCYVRRSSKPTHIISGLYFSRGSIISRTRIKYNGRWFSSQKNAKSGCDLKNLVKQTFYRACSIATGITPPWGILTGIRPLSVYRRHRIAGDEPHAVMKDEYFLAEDKIELLDKIFACQAAFHCPKPRDVSVYISIPFCPGKCSYCSFISISAVNARDLLDRYLNGLFDEIKAKALLINKYNLRVKSLYIGGGTPGILDERQLLMLMQLLHDSFDFGKTEEICFELGRPETVSDEKLKILKNFNVHRICINTQTTNDKILNIIGRNHNSQDYFLAVKKALKCGFNSINTDLIAGLPGEDYSSFCRSVDDVINSGVDNITVHTLAIKRAAKLSGCGDNFNPENRVVTDMLDYAYSRLMSDGYVPYYIYRQKNCVSNGENTGFCKPYKICGYNIYMMEDIHSIIACGAGASSKIIKDRKVNRVINVKYPMEYVSEYEKIIKNTDIIDKMLRAELTDE